MVLDYKIAKSETDWHDMRSKGLGGSDIGAMMGLNQYKSPYQLWLEKTGQVQEPDLSGKIAVQMGNWLEEFVAKKFEEVTGKMVQRDNKTYFHKDHPFLLANIDRKIIGEKAFLECKTTSAFCADQWEDGEIPASYLMQIQHYMNVLDYSYCYIAVVIGNQDFKWQKVERDDELIKIYTDRAKDFWHKVETMEAPEIDSSACTADLLGRLNLSSQAEESPLDAFQIDLVGRIQKLKKEIKDLEDARRYEENILKKFMVDGQYQALTSDSYRVTFKPTQTTRLDTKRLKADHPDIYKEYAKTTAYSRFMIKEAE